MYLPMCVTLPGRFMYLAVPCRDMTLILLVITCTVAVLATLPIDKVPRALVWNFVANKVYLPRYLPSYLLLPYRCVQTFQSVVHTWVPSIHAPSSARLSYIVIPGKQFNS